MTLRHISPRSVEWYEAILKDQDEPVRPEETLALRTMKALEDASIRAAISRVPRHQELKENARLPLPRLVPHAGHA